MKDPGTSRKVGEDTNIFESAPDAELNTALQTVNDLLPGADRLLRAAFDLNEPNHSANSPALGTENVRSEVSSAPPINQSKPAEELSAADSQLFGQPQNDPGNGGSDTTEFGATNEPGGFAQTSAGLANQVRQFQTALQSHAAAMSQQDAADLLAAIRQLGETFFRQSQNNVTRPEFEREKTALRRLIESKGK
ncbi:MAG TPA: hypothetical protein VG938_17360 [Verrucomicrobiae bacterium]|nr:hypothetical protein [Verrucomicrobiae bacterium]